MNPDETKQAHPGVSGGPSIVPYNEWMMARWQALVSAIRLTDTPLGDPAKCDRVQQWMLEAVHIRQTIQNGK